MKLDYNKIISLNLILLGLFRIALRNVSERMFYSEPTIDFVYFLHIFCLLNIISIFYHFCFSFLLADWIFCLQPKQLERIQLVFFAFIFILSKNVNRKSTSAHINPIQIIQFFYDSFKYQQLRVIKHKRFDFVRRLLFDRLHSQSFRFRQH